MFKIICLLSLFAIVPCWGQVGINTDNPEQALHIAGASGTIRMESLNATNNAQNGGDVNGDLDLTNDTFPLYVDENGDFTLELQTVAASDDTDAFDHLSLPNSSVFLPSSDSDGEVTTEITSFSITVNRKAILEVKYGISFDVYADATKTIISDRLSRRVENFLSVRGSTKYYGRSAKSYSSRSTDSRVGEMFNASSTYITLPNAGTYVISVMGLVSSNVTSDSSSTTSLDTYVEFATGNDFIFMRLY